MAMFEAWCGKCQETYVPDSPTELEHAECGEDGILEGAWVRPGREVDWDTMEERDTLESTPSSQTVDLGTGERYD